MLGPFYSRLWRLMAKKDQLLYDREIFQET